MRRQKRDMKYFVSGILDKMPAFITSIMSLLIDYQSHKDFRLRVDNHEVRFFLQQIYFHEMRIFLNRMFVQKWPYPGVILWHNIYTNLQ